MPTIVFCSSKGGAGKTTASVLLACELARQGADENIGVGLLDADPNQHSAIWARRPGRPEGLTLYAGIQESTMQEALDQATASHPLVIVDTEGVAGSATAAAISRADLVIIPCQPSQNDALEVPKAVSVVRSTARSVGAPIAVAVLFTLVKAAIVTKTGRALAEDIRLGNVDIFRCSLVDREPFRSIFSFGGSVHDLPVSTASERRSLQAAAATAASFAEEVKVRLAQLHR